MKLKNKNKGITLIALVITIIILLILAGVTIGQLTGNGLFDKVKLAKEEHENAQVEENATLGDYENKIDKYINNNRDNIIEDDFVTEKDYKAKRGEAEFTSLGLKAKSYDSIVPSDNISAYSSICTVERILENPIQLDGKFEISTRVLINNKNTANMGGMRIILYEKVDEEYKDSVNLYMEDSWGLENAISYGCNKNNINLINGGKWYTVNGSGTYGLIRDREKTHFYFGDELWGSTDFTDTIKIDKIEIQFFGGYSNATITPVILQNLYIGKPKYYKSIIGE